MRIIVFFLFLLPLVSLASGDCKGQSCNQSGGDTVVNTDVSVGGTDVNVGGTTIGDTNVSVPVTTGANTMTGGDMNNESLAIGLANSLGDVDIAGCLGSTQWATPLFSKQKLVVNWPCLTEFYLNNGMPEMAAVAICNTEIRKEFNSEEECRAAHPFKQMFEAEAVMVQPSTEHLEEQLEMQQQQIALLEEQAQRPAESRTIIQKVPYLNEQQRAKLEAVLNE